MNRRAKVINIVLLAVWCLSLLTNVSRAAISAEELQKIKDAVPEKARVRPNQPRKLLVFNLCNGFKHKSIPYIAKALEIMGRKTGAYDTVISSDMFMFKPENLNQFDAVCFNNTTKLKFEPALRESLMDFVKGGKGIVGIHAATDNFYDWPEAAKMMGGQFCGHPWGAKGTWAVKIDDPTHPLTAAFKGKGFKVKTEIYRTKAPFYSRDKQRVLMSLDMTDEATSNVKGLGPDDKDTGISWVKSYGKGRVFYCSLGHNRELFWNPKILQHYLDGIQFALGDLPADTAAGNLNLKALEDILCRVGSYNYGQSRKPLTDLNDFLRKSYSPEELKQIERRLLKFLRSDATLAGKQFICRRLGIIGTEASVPTLAKMLTNEETLDMALYTLERIPGSAVDEALRNALGKTKGKMKVGIINSLGERRDSESARVLRKLIYDSDDTTAAAAVAALGKISGSQATEALAKAKDRTTGKLRLLVLDAYLKCADALANRGQRKQAMEIYKLLYAPGEPVVVRIAALRGAAAAAPDELREIIGGALKSGDEQMQTAAIALVSEAQQIQELGLIAAELPNLSVAGQVQLLSALGQRGNSVVLTEVINATKSTEGSVRIAALKAIGKLGGALHVDLLAQTAAATKGAEQQAARQSLYGLGGPKVDQIILASIPRAEPQRKVELIRSIGPRNIVAGAETLLKTARNPDRNVRMQSLKVLRDIAEPEHIPALIELLVSAKSGPELKEAEKIVASVSRNAASESADFVLAALASVKDVEARCSLLRVLGKIGAGKALGALREALEDNNAEVRTVAIRGLCEWPDAEPMADLLKIVQSSDNKIHRALALRGYVRLIGLESPPSAGPAKETIKMYRQAMALASNVSEKKMVLSKLANIKSFAALQMAADYLEDNALQQEAAAAIVRIAEATGDSHPEQTRMLLRKVIEISKSDSLRKETQKMLDEIE